MSLGDFQMRIGVTADGQFGPNTLKAGVRYLDLTPLRGAHFFAQCAHESGNFRFLEENLRYSAEQLMKTWPRLFPTMEIAQQYEKNPQKIASRAYADRMGNGSEASEDGWKYRGRGAIQLTGRENYKAFADFEGHPEILYNPDLVASEYPIESALFFFDRNHLWPICDRGVGEDTITELTRRINGGRLGLEDRIKKTQQFYKTLTEAA